VFFHGNGMDRTDFMQIGELLHRRHGWGVVLASYPGYSGNPGSPSEASIMQAARATLMALQPLKGPLILWGHSLGSGVAARMASEGHATGLILESPYTSVTDMASRRFSLFPVRLLLRDYFDTQSLVARIKIPVLIIHAEGDPVIPFVMGKELAEKFGSRAVFYPLYKLNSHFPHLEKQVIEQVDQWLQSAVIVKRSQAVSQPHAMVTR